MVADFLIRFAGLALVLNQYCWKPPQNPFLNSIGPKPEWRPYLGASSLKWFSHNHDLGSHPVKVRYILTAQPDLSRLRKLPS